MKILGRIEHKIRNIKLLSKTGIQRIESIAKKIETEKLRMEKRQNIAY